VQAPVSHELGVGQEFVVPLAHAELTEYVERAQGGLHIQVAPTTTYSTPAPLSSRSSAGALVICGDTSEPTQAFEQRERGFESLQGGEGQARANERAIDVVNGRQNVGVELEKKRFESGKLLGRRLTRPRLFAQRASFGRSFGQGHGDQEQANQFAR
jgi:hypothetical protein